MKRTTHVRWISAVFGAVGLALATGGSAWAHVPAHSSIRPHQFFVGTVNGHPTDAVIDVLCPGPVDFGHAIGGQTLQVSPPGPSGPTLGFTGSRGRAIIANLSTATGLTASVARFTQYGSPAAFPTSLTVPCSGQGVVSFDPAPDSPTARAFDVTVTFVNIGV
jgi:hypothetical protein